MRDFDGKPWAPPVRRRSLGGTMPYSEARGLGGSTPYQNNIMPGETAGIPTPLAKKKGLSPDMMKALATGAIGGLGGGAGMTTAMAMQGIDVIRKLIQQRRASAGQQKPLNNVGENGLKGGGKVKGRTENVQKPNKQVPAPKKASGGMMKKKGC